jgi:hypothetical protein
MVHSPPVIETFRVGFELSAHHVCSRMWATSIPRRNGGSRTEPETADEKNAETRLVSHDAALGDRYADPEGSMASGLPPTRQEELAAALRSGENVAPGVASASRNSPISASSCRDVSRTYS